MIFTYDLLISEWSHTNENKKDIMFIGFSDGDKEVVEFDNLKYGIRILENSNIIFDETYPAENETIISTDQAWISYVSIDIAPSTDYSIYVWAENGGVKNDYAQIFTSSKDPSLESPFASWVWSEESKSYVPPVPKPEEGYWAWDEDNVSWVEV